ncbi:GntR family transcriptional regulator [Pseudorhodoferax sp.]|uniref:GntR family transcriptional regulator n=1 Tax=Pseudorhodoferax sp. TaxID=1993553 RepID=UPI002DD6B85C|nr:GntR family transcriptional regulator [Pseudorhodoferax sp.]
MPDPIPLRGASLHDGVASRLRTMIFEGQLAPGGWVDEKQLAATWQVSRTPLREALKVLASEGLVELVPHRGCRVVEISDADADDLFPVMALLEGRCALEAVRNADDTALARLRHLHGELERHAAAGDIEAYFRLNHEFHSLVQALADNRWLDRVTGDLRRFMRLMRGRQLQLPGRLQASINEHRVLMDAFEQRDAHRAERAMHDHLLAQLVAFKKLRQPARSRRAPSATPATSRG